jgi:hypothetical protein
MKIMQEQIDQWRATVQDAHRNALASTSLLAGGEPMRAAPLAREVAEMIRLLAADMDRASAGGAEKIAGVPEVSVHLLGTPANRRYLAHLREALESGRDVDEERGYGRSGSGPAAAVLEMLCYETAQEVDRAEACAPEPGRVNDPLPLAAEAEVARL